VCHVPSSYFMFLFCFGFEIGSCYVSQAGLELISSCLSLLSAGITGVYHFTVFHNFESVFCSPSFICSDLILLPPKI
jgi:hypothetical protein